MFYHSSVLLSSSVVKIVFFNLLGNLHMNKNPSLTFKKFKKQAGFGLLDVIGALVIGAVAVAAVSPIISSALDDTKVEKDVDMANFAKTKVMSFTSNSPNTSGVTTAWAISNRAIPSDKINGAVINNNLGGTFAFAPATITNANDAVTITSNHYNQPQCNAVAKKLASGFLTVVVNAATIKNTTDNAANEVALAAACKNQNNNVIIVSFLKG